MGKSTHSHPLHARPSYLGCLMGTSNTSSGGIWKSSGSLPLAWRRSGRTSKRPLGGFQPCCMQICNQTRPGQATSSGNQAPAPPSTMALGRGRAQAPVCQKPLPPEGLGHATSIIRASLTSPRNQHHFSWSHRTEGRPVSQHQALLCFLGLPCSLETPRGQGMNLTVALAAPSCTGPGTR